MSDARWRLALFDFPGNSDAVIVAVDDGITRSVTVACWDGDSWSTPEECRPLYGRVIRWMPLPELPND